MRPPAWRVAQRRWRRNRQRRSSRAIRAWSTPATAVSSPRPAFASSSGCGDWWSFSCRRQRPRASPTQWKRTIAAGPTTRILGSWYSSDSHFRFSVGGVGDERRLVLDPGVGVAVAQFRRAERGECFGVGGDLRRTERLDVLRDGLFIRRTREGRDDAEQVQAQAPARPADDDRYSWLPPFFGCERDSLAAGRSLVERTVWLCASPDLRKPWHDAASANVTLTRMLSRRPGSL